MNLPVLIAAKALPDFHARIVFADGFASEIDLRPVCTGPVFGLLRDEDVFRQIRVEFDAICWPGGVDIAPETLRLWCERGEILGEDETASALAGKAQGLRVAERP